MNEVDFSLAIFLPIAVIFNNSWQVGSSACVVNEAWHTKSIATVNIGL